MKFLKSTKPTIPKVARWSRRELIIFFERLELYVSAGLTIDNILNIILSDSTKQRANTIDTIRKIVEKGGTLTFALQNSIKLSSTLAGLIEHGESSGELGKALGYCKQLLEREDELIKKCSSAMTYPIVIGIFAILLTVGLMKGVMPQIIPMLNSLHVHLPLLTRIVMALTQMVNLYGLLFALLAGMVAVAITILCKKSPRMREFLQSIIGHMPIVGTLVNLYFISIFVRSLGSLIETGVPASLAYERVVNTLKYAPLTRICMAQREAVSRGVTLGIVMAEMKILPRFISSLVSAGEATGSLGTSLRHAAGIVDRDIEHALKKLTALVEPVMMAFMGLGIGGIALSIIMPIYDVSKVLQH